MQSKMISALLIMIIVTGIVAPAVYYSGKTSLPTELLPAIDEFSILPRASDIGGETFTENRGQVENNDVRFYAASGNVAFTRGSVFLYLSEQHENSVPASKHNPIARTVPVQNPRRDMVQFSFAGSNDVLPVGCDPVPWQSNYIMGNNSALWRTNITSYRGIMYPNLWDGIDLVYRTENMSLKYEFIVHPYAVTSNIKILVEGQESISITENGALAIALESGKNITDSGLDVFYADNENEKVGASFVLTGDDAYSFDINGRDPARTIVIDPLIYSTFLGGSGFDYVTDVAVGNDGCAYVTGYTNSVDFPTKFDAYESDYTADSYDIFVTKMGLNGDSFVYSTYIGSVAGDYSQAISVDASGCAYITGYTTSHDFPTTIGAYDRAHNGGDPYDTFIVKLAPFGDSLAYSTYLGGITNDYGYDIAVDGNGFVYVTGETWPTFDGPPEARNGGKIQPKFDSPPKPLYTNEFYYTFPTTSGAFRWSKGYADIFVTKLDQLGEKLIYSSAFGTTGFEYSNSITVDSSGYAYITGWTRSPDFPVSTTAFDRSHNGGYDTFVLKLSQSGSTLIFSTFLGGSNGDYGCEIAVGAWGNVYVTGYTSSTNFPTTEGAYDTTHNGAFDVFVTMLGKYGESLGYSTYIGGSDNDYGSGIALDSLGYAYVAGYTTSSDYPITADAFDNTFNGTTDAFMSKISTSGTLLQSIYLGGDGNDYGRGIVISKDGFAYIAGETSSLNFPIATGALDTSFNGNCDAFVTKLDISAPATYAGPDQRILESETAILNGGGSTDNQGIVNYTWAFYDGAENVTIYGKIQQHLFMIPGIYTIILNASDVSGNWATDIMVITVVDITHPIAMAGPDQIVNEGTFVAFDGSSSTDNVGIVNYSWTFMEGNKAITLYGNSSVYNFTMPGTYIVTLKVLDEAGNDGTDSLAVSVIDITRPTANAGANRRVYKDTIVKFDGTASSDNVAVINYTWQFNDGLGNRILYGATPSHLFTEPGIYTVTLSVADAVGHFDTDEMMLTVLEIIKPVAEAGPDMVVNERTQTRFDGSGSTDNVGVAQWAWSFNDGLNDVTIFGVSPIWIFMFSGVYSVTLNASDEAGNWDIDTMTVSVLDSTPPIAIAGPNQIVTEGTVVTFSALGSTDRSGIVNYAWNFTYNGTMVTLYGSNSSFQFWTPGSYLITITVRDAAGNQASETTTVTVQTFTLQENAIWADEYGLILISLSVAIILLAVALLLHRRKKVIR